MDQPNTAREPEWRVIYSHAFTSEEEARRAAAEHPEASPLVVGPDTTLTPNQFLSVYGEQLREGTEVPKGS